MARPTKATATQTGHISKKQKQARKEQEEKLKGKADKIKPPAYLNDDQKKVFKVIVKELEAAGILSNLDIYILSTCAIAIVRLINIEHMINEDEEYILNKSLMSAKDKYTKDFFRCCNELSLSPQSRAKLGNLAAQAKDKEQDLLLKALKEDDDDD